MARRIVSADELREYARRPMAPPDPSVLAAIDVGPIRPADALPRAEMDRMLDPTPLAAETGWAEKLDDGTAFVAVRTEMPGVNAAMVDWWFDWHPRDGARYRAWHPLAHQDNRVDPPRIAGAKPFWNTVHHPVEDVGTGKRKVRIEFKPPSQLGFATDALDTPGVGTVVCGFAGDESLHVAHTVMAHVFLETSHGLALRSAFWLGARIRPYLPPPFPALAAPVLDLPAVRRRAMPSGVAPALARHCAEEYANLAVLLPELYGRFGR
jgi:hypothetical protein